MCMQRKEMDSKIKEIRELKALKEELESIRKWHHWVLQRKWSWGSSGKWF